ncbi:MAG: transposase [Gammaproteobacteria bacterium]
MPKKKQAAPYTESFRREAVRRSEEEGVTAVQVAKELGLHVQSDL